MIARALVLGALLLITACRGVDDPGGNAGVFFPRHGNSGPHALALLEGRLKVSEGCLLLVDANGTQRLPIWPGGFGMRRSAALQVTDPSGRIVAVEGEGVTLVGGEYPAEFAIRLMGQNPPRACRGYGFWVVGAIAPEGRSAIP